MKGMSTMYNAPNMYQYPYNANTPMRNAYNMYQYPYFANTLMYNPDLWNQFSNQYLPYMNQDKSSTPIILKDYGPCPLSKNY